MSWRQSCLVLLADLALGGVAFAQTPPTPPTFTAVALPDPLGGLAAGSLRDGGSSATANGVSYWLFDDTETYSPSYDFVTNSFAATANLNQTGGITLELNYANGNGTPAQFIPYSQPETDYNTAHAVPLGSKWSDENCPAKADCGSVYKLWPYSLVYDAQDRQFVSAFQDFIASPSATGWIYTGVGAGLSTGHLDKGAEWPTMTRPTQSTNPDPELSTLLWPASVQSFADTGVIDGNYYYQYGDTNSQNLFLARIQIHGAGHSFADLTNPASWQYFHGGSSWDNSQANLASLFAGGNEGFPIFFDHYLNMWVALYIPPLSQEVQMRVASQPEGPWSAAVDVFQGVNIGGSPNYAPRAHLGFGHDGQQTVYVSYSSLEGQVPYLEKVTFNK